MIVDINEMPEIQACVPVSICVCAAAPANKPTLTEALRCLIIKFREFLPYRGANQDGMEGSKGV